MATVTLSAMANQLMANGLIALLAITFIAAGIVVLRHYVDY